MEDDVFELIFEARNLIRSGRAEDGLHVLDRVLDPKWKDVTECDGQYRMFDPDAPIEPFRTGLANALGMQIAVHAPGTPHGVEEALSNA